MDKETFSGWDEMDLPGFPNGWDWVISIEKPANYPKNEFLFYAYHKCTIE